MRRMTQLDILEICIQRRGWFKGIFSYFFYPLYHYFVREENFYEANIRNK
jgi:hypothetical protein